MLRRHNIKKVQNMIDMFSNRSKMTKIRHHQVLSITRFHWYYEDIIKFEKTFKYSIENHSIKKKIQTETTKD